MNDDSAIIIITIVSTIIALFYSYDSIKSYYNSLPLYKFLLKLYDENEKLILNNEEKIFIL